MTDDKAYQKDLAALKELVRVSVAVMKCSKAKCKKEAEALAKQRDKMMPQIVKYGKQYEAKELSLKEYTAKMKKLGDDIKESETNLEYLACSLKTCRKQINTMLALTADMLSDECKKEKKKKLCKQEKDIRAALKTKDLSAKQLMQVTTYQS